MNRETNPDSTNFKYMYGKLKDLTEYHCEPHSICLPRKPRSNFDEMMAKRFRNVRPASAQFRKSWERF